MHSKRFLAVVALAALMIAFGHARSAQAGTPGYKNGSIGGGIGNIGGMGGGAQKRYSLKKGSSSKVGLPKSSGSGSSRGKLPASKAPAKKR